MHRIVILGQRLKELLNWERGLRGVGYTRTEKLDRLVLLGLRLKGLVTLKQRGY